MVRGDKEEVSVNWQQRTWRHVGTITGGEEHAGRGRPGGTPVKQGKRGLWGTGKGVETSKGQTLEIKKREKRTQTRKGETLKGRRQDQRHAVKSKEKWQGGKSKTTKNGGKKRKQKGGTNT